MARPDHRPGWGFVGPWFGQALANAASSLVFMALGLYLYERTGSATVFGLLMCAATLPEVVVTPLSGTSIDRLGPWPVLAGCNAGRALVALALLGLSLSGRMAVAPAVALVAVAGVVGSPLWPAFATFTTTAVHRDGLERANGLVELGPALGQVAAPVTAGWLLTRGLLDPALALSAVAFAAAAAIFVRVARRAQPERPTASRAPSPVAGGSLRAGLAVMRRRPDLRAFLVFEVVVMACTGVAEILVVPYVRSFASVQTLGIILSVGGLGMVASSLLVAWRGLPERLPGGPASLSVLSGLSLLVMVAYPSPLTVAAGVTVAMACFPLLSAWLQTIWQRRIPVAEQGRVFAFLAAAVTAALPAAYLGAGPLASLVGTPRATLALLGLVLLANALVVVRLPRALDARA